MAFEIFSNGSDVITYGMLERRLKEIGNLGLDDVILMELIREAKGDALDPEDGEQELRKAQITKNDLLTVFAGIERFTEIKPNEENQDDNSKLIEL